MIINIAALALSLVAGNASANSHTASARVDSASMTVVSVENERNVPVTVYVERGSEDVRLGVVDPHVESTLRIPDRLAHDGEVRFFVEPAGGIEESTDYLDVDSGQRIGLLVPLR